MAGPTYPILIIIAKQDSGNIHRGPIAYNASKSLLICDSTNYVAQNNQGILGYNIILYVV